MQKAYILILLAAICQAWEVNFEVQGSNKACISDRFAKGHPVSVRATLLENIEVTGFAFLLVIEDETRAPVSNSQYDHEAGMATAFYNNDEDQSLYICIDNYMSYSLYMSLNIKSEQEFSSSELAPSKSEFDVLDQTLGKIDKMILESFAYAQGLEHYASKIISAGTSFENKVTLFSIIAIAVIFVVGYLQFHFIKKELQQKKIV